MVVKGLRQKRHWSQEQLAELSGLSLRTIQRIEGCDRISPESMLTLAATFEIELVALERELAMDKQSIGWKRRPTWVRGLFLGSSHVQMDKQQHKKVELVSAIAGIGFVISGICSTAGYFVPISAATPLLISGSLLLLGAYLMSAIACIGDQHSVWPWVNSDTD